MRPTDENQPTSMRPNLMSPRRASTSGEDSILAMLEREPARRRGGGTSNLRLACYGAGAAMAMALTGALVWLAANNDGVQRELPEAVLADAGQASAATTPAASPADVPGGGAALRQVAMAPPVPEARPASAAVIVDQAPPADAMPPLRLLKPAPAGASAPPVRVPASAAKPPARPAVASAPRPAPAAPPAPKAPARPAAAVKPKPVLAAKNAARPSPLKAQRTGPAKAADAPVDADVALISAVIVHANGHAPEGSQMTELLCANDSCQAKPSRQ